MFEMDLRIDPLLPKPFDNGSWNCCVGSAISVCHSYAMRKAGYTDWLSSRAFIYHNAQKLDGSLGKGDTGATLSMAVVGLLTYGACQENSETIHPPDGLVARRVDLENPTYPFAFGMRCHQSYSRAKVSGRVPFPGPRERLLCNHTLACVGYHTRLDSFIVIESKGTGWGMDGFEFVPRKLMQKCTEMWSISLER